MTLYRREPCEHGEVRRHRAPDEDSYLSTVICAGAEYVPVEEPVYTETAVRKALRIAVTWRGYDWQVGEIVNEIMREIGDTDDAV